MFASGDRGKQEQPGQSRVEIPTNPHMALRPELKSGHIGSRQVPVVLSGQQHCVNLTRQKLQDVCLCRDMHLKMAI